MLLKNIHNGESLWPLVSFCSTNVLLCFRSAGRGKRNHLRKPWKLFSSAKAEKSRASAPFQPKFPAPWLHPTIHSRLHTNALYILTLKHLRKGICPNILLSIDKFCICCNRVIHALVSRTFQWSYIAVKKKMHHSSSKRIWSTSLLWPTPHCLALHLQYSSVGRSAEKEEPHESICVEGSLSHCLGEKLRRQSLGQKLLYKTYT